MEATSRARQGVSVGSGLGGSPIRSTRFSQAVCIHCGRSLVGLPRESAQFGIVSAECTTCYRKRLVTDLQQQIADKQRKAVGR